ncbi:hypothetical protein AB0M64_16100 [Streptomyces sp. NPDC051771]|uniref:hypothetical protein n=1 Tax=Streptomyces sp. NPDC051771 TaxID=3154847 RepID=UPI0034278939
MPGSTDPAGIPLSDARRRILDALDHVTFELGDALHAAVSMPQSPEPPEEGSRLRLDGFLLRDHATARLYVTTPGIADRLGLDVSLHDDNGRVRAGNTVYDFTHW